ncbi:MAG TPA: hypothetical protein DCE78_02560 [Bacteroidetes bacterium]|nr:hypothetical protein [Bacteroidota bacterium]
MLILEIAFNLSLYVAFAIISGYVEKRVPSRNINGTVLQGLLFGGVAILGMLQPFTLAEGIFFDGRSVVISLSVLFFGPITGLITTILVVTTRIIMGGDGILMGVAVAISAFLIGLLFRKYWDRKSVPSAIFLLGMGLAVHVVMVMLMILLPSNMQMVVFQTVTVSILILYPFATLLSGKILSDQVTIRGLSNDLQESEQKFRAIFNSMNEAIFLHDAETGMIVDFNDSTIELYRFKSREQVINNFMRNLSANDESYNSQSGLDNLNKAVAEGSHTFDWLARRADNELFWAEISLKHFKLGEKGYVIAVVRDINERKTHEDKNVQELHEKEVLLAEVHHRVKNNLAIISSLLSLQLDSINDDAAREIMMETDKRIRSISLVHELVYNNENLESVDFGTFLHEMIPIIDTFSSPDSCVIDVDIDAGHLELSLNKSVPCALIVTEIITNSYKHAFKGRTNGHIDIKFYQEDEEFHLIVRDDGKGVDDLYSMGSSGSFGYTIIQGLVSQIGGKIEFMNVDPGLLVHINFKSN